MSQFEIDVDTVQESALEASALSGTKLQGLPSQQPLVQAKHAENGDDEDIMNWGIHSIDAPIFMMSLSTVQQHLQSAFDVKAPKQSLGITQAEADKRLVTLCPLIPHLMPTVAFSFSILQSPVSTKIQFAVIMQWYSGSSFGRLVTDPMSSLHRRRKASCSSISPSTSIPS